jgi:hypothetical protein
MRMTRLFHSTSLGLPIAALALQLSSAFADAVTLEGAIYKESYRAESTYPTSADVDRFQLGGMEGFTRGGDPFQTTPRLNGTSALANVTSVGGFAFDNEVVGAGVVIGDLLDRGEPLSVAGHFDRFRVEAFRVDGSIVWLGASGFAAVLASRPDGYFASASVFEFHSAAGKFVSLNIAEYDGFALRSVATVPIPLAVEGVPFTITLLVDPVEQTAVARLRLDDQDFETPAIALTAFDGRQEHALVQALGVANRSGALDLGPGDTASADLVGFCVSGLRDDGNVCRRRGSP